MVGKSGDDCHLYVYIIVSYNFRHIVKVKTITMTESINIRENYRRIGIFSPTEVIDYD